MSPDAIKALFERRMKAVEELRALAAQAEGRDYTAEEKATEERMERDIAQLHEKITKGLEELEREQRSADALQRYERLTKGAAPVQRQTDNSQEIEKALRATLKGEQRGFRHDIDAQVSSAYSLETRSWEQRDILETTGGMPLPTSFSGRLYEALVASTATLRAKANSDTLILTGSGEPMVVPRATAHGAAAWRAEGVAAVESDPTLSFITLNAWDASQALQVSREMVNDQGFPIVDYISRSMGRNAGLLAGAAFVTGDGTAKPTGWQPNATVGVTGPVGTTISLGTQATAGQGSDLLVDLFYSVAEPYRSSPSAAWIMNDATVAKVARLKGTGGEIIWQPGLVPGAPDTLLGKPIFTDPNMPVMAANAKSIAFGDWNGYAVRISRGIEVLSSEHFAFTSGLITYVSHFRVDGKLIDTGAIKLFQNSAT